MWRLKAVALALVLACAGVARAQGGDEILLLDLCVNGSCPGVAAVVLRGDQVLIETEALREAGADIDALPTITVGERLFVDGKTINLGTRERMDCMAMSVDLENTAENLQPPEDNG